MACDQVVHDGHIQYWVAGAQYMVYLTRMCVSLPCHVILLYTACACLVSTRTNGWYQQHESEASMEAGVLTCRRDIGEAPGMGLDPGAYPSWHGTVAARFCDAPAALLPLSGVDGVWWQAKTNCRWRRVCWMETVWVAGLKPCASGGLGHVRA